MVDLQRDSIIYMNEGVKVVKHTTLGLVMLLKSQSTNNCIQRALATTKTKLSSGRKRSNGCSYYSLEEV